MQSVARVLDVREKHAMDDMAQSKRLLDGQIKKLDELELYYKEYTGQIDSKGKDGISSSSMSAYMGFIEQLAQAIVVQKEVVEQAKNNTHASVMHWQERRKDVKKISNIVDKLKWREHREQERKEQLASDDFSQRRYVVR